MSETNPGLMTLFAEALKLTNPTERSAYLDGACAGDAALRRQVEKLLFDHQRGEQYLEPDATSAHEPLLPDATVGDVLGSTGTYATDGTGAYLPGAPTETHSGRTNRPDRPITEGVGTVIAGRYTLVDVIGEGGMGSVYLASQTNPVRRQVALKLIKAGMDSKGVLARFDAERQALALWTTRTLLGSTTAGLPPPASRSSLWNW